MLGLGNIGRMVFGRASDRRVKRYRPTVEAINALEPEVEKLSDAELKARTDEFRQALAGGKTLNDLLVPAFATGARGGEAHARPAAFRRAAGRRHGAERGRHRRDEDRRRQDAGRHPPDLSERACRQGVHVVTVNDYLARRDAEWMGRIYEFLGLSVGVIVHGLTPDQRRQAYAADVTYGTNNEFGFDYLRDNMEYSLEFDGAARALLRDRRRGGLHPGRRGAHAADHFRPDRGPLRALHLDRQDHPAARRRTISSSTRRCARRPSPRTAPRSVEKILQAAGALQGRARSTTSRTSPSCTT